MPPALKAPTRHRHQPGSNLMLLVAVAVVILGFLGISVYTGLQAFVESDLQRLCMNAAMVGASQYYQSNGSSAPRPNGGGAKGLAESTFNALSGNSSVGGFGTSLTSVTNHDATDSITVKATSAFETAFLAPIGIKQIEVNATATARALKYEPTEFTGPITITPDGVNPKSYTQTMTLGFPLIDGPGNDLYVEQDPSDQQGYKIEACNTRTCYDISSGATKIGSSPPPEGHILYGTTMIDIGKAGVHKAVALRFTHSNQFKFFDHGQELQLLPPIPTRPLKIQRVMLFGYAGACKTPTLCGIPAGFKQVF